MSIYLESESSVSDLSKNNELVEKNVYKKLFYKKLKKL